MDAFYEQLLEVGKKLEAIKWISGTGSDRQDVWYEWTDLGKSKFGFFISEMRNSGVFSEKDIAFINKSIFYLGIKSKSRKEHLYENLREFYDKLGNEPLKVKAGEKQGIFGRAEIFSAIDWIYLNNKVEVKVFKHQEGDEDWIMKIPPGVYASSVA